MGSNGAIGAALGLLRFAWAVALDDLRALRRAIRQRREARAMRAEALKPCRFAVPDGVECDGRTFCGPCWARYTLAEEAILGRRMR